MKCFIAVFLSILAALNASGCTNADMKNIGYARLNAEQSQCADGQYFYAADDVKLAVFRCNDRLFAYCPSPCATVGWEDITSYDDNNGGIDLESGGFGFVTADVTYISGGFAGSLNVPRIDKLKSFEKADLPEILRFYPLLDFTEGWQWKHNMLKYDDGERVYLLFRMNETVLVKDENGNSHRMPQYNVYVFLDGEQLAVYDFTEYEPSDIVSDISENGGII